MNLLKKIYCRTFQAFMRAAIPFMPYRQPEILQSVTDVAAVLKNKKIDKVLIVTDGGVVKCGLTEELKESLTDNSIAFAVYDKTLPNPTINAVECARELYIQENCRAIIALGGGSAMDLAKACGARIVRPKKSLIKMGGLLHVRKKLPPLFAIPTTAGTGSETTIAAVITDASTHRKYAINDFSLIPHYAVLDYKLTLGLPASLTAYTGMDAMTHAVEAFIGRSTTRKTRAKAIEAVKLINENILTCYNEPTNAEARKNMLFASHYAGIAFTISYVGYVHAVAHSLSGMYGLGHGLTNAVLLPVVLQTY
ncbi:MAG: iron-containing alcohol dehydrogenase, partial [Clostridia bacterium]|nr:iron-containing alcohol dehydrogenase [Clostridia bacterium]